MLYFFYGDRKKSKSSINKTVEVLHNKKPEAEIFKLNSEKISLGEIENLSGGAGLFEQKSIVVLNEICDEFDEKDLKKIVSLVADSENVFLWFEEKISADILKEIKKKAEKFAEVKKTEENKIRFNAFSLADALAGGDKKKLWVLYHRALQNNLEPEEILGILFWQVKALILAKKTKTAIEAGLAPYAYSKAKKTAENFPEEKLKEMLNFLVETYHSSRKTGGDLELLTEKFILA